MNAAWRDYGNRVGAFRLFDRLAAFGIRPTVLLNTAIFDHAPAVIHAARAVGAEFVAPSHANFDTLATMSPAEEASYIRAVYERIALEEGTPPAGWSSTWLVQSAATLDILAAQEFR